MESGAGFDETAERASLCEMKFNDLRGIAKELHCGGNGKKAEIVERIVESKRVSMVTGVAAMGLHGHGDDEENRAENQPSDRESLLSQGFDGENNFWTDVSSPMGPNGTSPMRSPMMKSPLRSPLRSPMRGVNRESVLEPGAGVMFTDVHSPVPAASNANNANAVLTPLPYEDEKEIGNSFSASPATPVVIEADFGSVGMSRTGSISSTASSPKHSHSRSTSPEQVETPCSANANRVSSAGSAGTGSVHSSSNNDSDRAVITADFGSVALEAPGSASVRATSPTHSSVDGGTPSSAIITADFGSVGRERTGSR